MERYQRQMKAIRNVFANWPLYIYLLFVYFRVVSRNGFWKRYITLHDNVLIKGGMYI